MILYFEPHSGVSGDMFVGALLDMHINMGNSHVADYLDSCIKSLNLPNVHIEIVKATRAGVVSTKFNVVNSKTGLPVEDSPDEHGRTMPMIEKIIQGSDLPAPIINDSIAVFKKLATAEAKVHNSTIDQVHFHEVGAVDAIVDIVGGVSMVHFMKVSSVCSSPINVGYGTVNSAHGILPIPAPATMEMLTGEQFYTDKDSMGELATPTGVALLTYFSQKYNSTPSGDCVAMGYGAGTKERQKPNVLKVSSIASRV